MSGRTFIADLTVDELQQLIRTTVAEAMQAQPRWVSGVKGLMDIFDCSKSTALRIKAGGTIDKAIKQQGRTFVTNVPLALQLYGNRNKRLTA